jgi:hypothetical protein
MKNNLKDSLDIMSTVWANSGGGFAFISTKGSKWTDKKIHWSNYSAIKDHLQNQNPEENGHNSQLLPHPMIVLLFYLLHLQ